MIITWDISLPKKVYTWDSRWISDYESAWSVFEKFKFYNSFSDSDIFKLFGSDVIKRKKSNTWSGINRNLYALSTIFAGG
jgi:hypothetical protein